MRNKGLLNTFLVLVFLSIGGIVAYINIPKSINTSILNSSNIEMIDSHKNKIENIFKLNFPLKKNEHQTAMTYVMDKQNISMADGDYYKKIFDIEEDWISLAYKDVCTGDNSTLEIYKNKNLVKYINNDIKISDNLLEEEEIKNIAVEFLQDYKLNFMYKKILITKKDNLFHVNFINNTGKYPNHSFSNKILIDETGNVIEVEIYLMDFKEYKDVKIISMKESYFNLPDKFGERVYLDECEIVYIFDNSILQPAYYYKGSNNNGNGIEVFVKATIF